MNILKYKSKRKIFSKTSKLLLKSVRVIVQKTSRKIAKITVKTFEDLNDNKCTLIVGMVHWATKHGSSRDELRNE